MHINDARFSVQYVEFVQQINFAGDNFIFIHRKLFKSKALICEFFQPLLYR
jgi:hypothetical protein